MQSSPVVVFFFSMPSCGVHGHAKRKVNTDSTDGTWQKGIWRIEYFTAVWRFIVRVTTLLCVAYFFRQERVAGASAVLLCEKYFGAV